MSTNSVPQCTAMTTLPSFFLNLRLANMLQQLFCCLVVFNSWKNYGFWTDINLLFLVTKTFFYKVSAFQNPQGFAISIFGNCEKCYFSLCVKILTPLTETKHNIYCLSCVYNIGFQVLDFGCAECKLLRFLISNEVSTEHLVGVDIDGDLLQESKFRIEPLIYDYLHPKEVPFTVTTLQGNGWNHLTNYDIYAHSLNVKTKETVTHKFAELLASIHQTSSGLSWYYLFIQCKEPWVILVPWLSMRRCYNFWQHVASFVSESKTLQLKMTNFFAVLFKKSSFSELLYLLQHKKKWVTQFASLNQSSKLLTIMWWCHTMFIFRFHFSSRW